MPLHAGSRIGPYEILSPLGTGGFVSVRFHPWGACHFFAHPVSAFADGMVTAADLWGDAAAGVEERDRGRRINAWPRAGHPTVSDSAAASAPERFDRGPDSPMSGGSRPGTRDGALPRLAHQAGYYDQAHCIADFTAFAGMTPRAFGSADKTAFLDIG